jgi:integrase
MARKGYKVATFTLPDGRRKYVTAKTKEKLENRILDLKLDMRMGVDLSDATTVGELAEMWYHLEKEGKVKESTSYNWKRILGVKILPYLKNVKVKDVTPATIQSVISKFPDKSLVDNRKQLNALRGMFDLAMENGIIVKSPVLPRFKAVGRENIGHEALTPEQETALLDSVFGTRACLFVWLGLKTGLRRGELLGLKWDALDLRDAVVHVKRNLVIMPQETCLYDTLKTETSCRSVPIPADLLEALKKEKARATSLFLFHRDDGSHYDYSSFKNFWKLVSRRAGPVAPSKGRCSFVVTDRPVTPHVLRHTYATRLFESGLDIKEVQHLLGHADPQITLRLYVHYCEQTRENATFSRVREAMQR